MELWAPTDNWFLGPPCSDDAFVDDHDDKDDKEHQEDHNPPVGELFPGHLKNGMIDLGFSIMFKKKEHPRWFIRHDLPFPLKDWSLWVWITWTHQQNCQVIIPSHRNSFYTLQVQSIFLFANYVPFWTQEIRSNEWLMRKQPSSFQLFPLNMYLKFLCETEVMCDFWWLVQHFSLRTWKGGITTDVAVGRLAFRLASDCFVALVRGRRTDEGDEAGRSGDRRGARRVWRHGGFNVNVSFPIPSIYGIFAYIWLFLMGN